MPDLDLGELFNSIYAVKKRRVDAGSWGSITILIDPDTGDRVEREYSKMFYKFYRHMTRYRKWVQRNGGVDRFAKRNNARFN